MMLEVIGCKFLASRALGARFTVCLLAGIGTQPVLPRRTKVVGSGAAWFKRWKGVRPVPEYDSSLYLKVVSNMAESQNVNGSLTCGRVDWAVSMGELLRRSEIELD